jgi:hypothetical protein
MESDISDLQQSGYLFLFCIDPELLSILWSIFWLRTASRANI